MGNSIEGCSQIFSKPKTFEEYRKIYPLNKTYDLPNKYKIMDTPYGYTYFKPDGSYHDCVIACFQKHKEFYPYAPITELENGCKMMETPYAFIYFNELGQIHRDGNLPAYQGKDGDNEYAVNGHTHRTNGPAIEYHSTKEYEFWNHGKKFKQSSSS